MFELFNDYHSRMKHFSANVRWYLVALTLNSLGMGVFQVIYNLYLKELHYDEAFVGQTISLKALAAVIILLPAGFLSDKIGRRKSMIIGALFCGFSFITLGVLELKKPILTLIFLNGLFNAFFMVAQSPFMMENTSPRERLHLFSINSVLMLGGWMGGNILGGAIPDLLKIWIPQLMAMKATVILSGVITLGAVIPLLQIREVKNQQQRGFDQIMTMLSDKKEMATIAKFVLPSAMVGFGAGLFVPYTTLYLANEFALSTSVIGVVQAIGQVSTAVAALIGPALARRIGRVKAIFIFQMTSIPFLLTMATTPWATLAIIAVLLRTAFMNGANPLTSNLMMEEVGANVKGIANSLSQMAFQLGWAVMGPISGMIIASRGYSHVFFLAMVFYLGSAVSYYVFFRKLDEGTAGAKVAS